MESLEEIESNQENREWWRGNGNSPLLAYIEIDYNEGYL